MNDAYLFICLDFTDPEIDWVLLYAKSGIPQGLVIGPTLLVLIIKDGSTRDTRIAAQSSRRRCKVTTEEDTTSFVIIRT